MNVLEISPKEYKLIFPSPYHVFNSISFNELNKYKCDSVHYLIFRDSKTRLGLVIGEKNNVAFSPFSAPYGCFSFLDERIDIDKIDESIQVLDGYLIEKKISSTKFILPPFCYNVSFLSKLVNSLSRNNYKTSIIDLNHIFKTSFFDEKYKENIHQKTRNNLNKALKQNFVFQKTEDIDLVYSINSINKELRGFPLRMTLEQVKETLKIIKHDAFVVKLNQDYVASALIYYTANNIVQIIYWGDILEFSSMKTMNFLSYKIFEYYKNAGIQIVDLGPSSENGIPNYGLCHFKESIGCVIENKFTFEKKTVNVEFADYSKEFLEKSWEWLNDPEIKHLTNTSCFSKEDQLKWFNSLPDRSDYKVFGVLESGKPIGVFGLKNITAHDAEYWGYIGEKDSWGKKIGELIVKRAIEIAKEKNIGLLYLKVIPNNERAIRLYEKMNFVCTGIENNLLIMQLCLK